jgi:hypothetical protein
MNWKAQHILSILDQCCDTYEFPMLDNGYVYLAATRLSLYRSEDDWAIVTEVFGFFGPSGDPDTQICTFASRLRNRKSTTDFVSMDAYNDYLRQNPYNESRSIFPIEQRDWQDTEHWQFLAEGSRSVVVRGQKLPIPAIDEYARYGITLTRNPRIKCYEFCRLLAAIAREKVLATPSERRENVLPELRQIMQLEEWNHPNVVDDEDRPSGSETFQQLAQVLVTGDVNCYRPTLEPNTHWKNWPQGGSL